MFVLTSFFGALMIAGAYAYFSYTFQRYHFIDFSKSVLYAENALFWPSEKRYTVLVFNSGNQHWREELGAFSSEYPILAIDLHQGRFPGQKGWIYASAGMNTLLGIIQRFNIYEVPCAFDIEHQRQMVYKQESELHLFSPAKE